MLDDWTILAGGVRRLDTSSNPDLAPVTAAVDADVRNHIAAYRSTLSGGGPSLPASSFTVKSVAERLHAGIGPARRDPVPRADRRPDIGPGR
jgi:hypothetical protein